MEKFVILTFSILAMLIYACNEPTLVGEEIIPELEGVNSEFIDTLTVNLKTVEEDSVRTDELGVLLLGGMESPNFGNVYADFYSQVRIPSNNLDFGENSEALAIHLNLDYSAVFGDSLSKQSFTVYRLDESISIEEDYYSTNVPVFTTENELARIDNYEHSYSDSVSIFGNKVGPRLQIELDLSLAQSFLNADPSVFENNDAFLEFFKGFYIKYDKINSENNLMVLYNLISSISNITMYYQTKDSSDTVIDTLSQVFLINSNAENVANYDKDFSTAVVNSVIDQNDQAELFVQNLGSYFLKMDLPYLDNLNSLGDVIINQAKISFVRIVEDSVDNQFSAPQGFAFQYKDPNDTLGNLVIINDANTQAYDYGGGLESFTAPDGTQLQKYEFNCTIFLNEVLKGRIVNPQMFIVPLARRNAPFRTKIAGATHPDYPTKINIIYSVIN